MGTKQTTLVCRTCGAEFEARRTDAKFCSICRCLGKTRCPICGAFKERHGKLCVVCHGKAHRGTNNSNWQGGKSLSKKGHILILKPEGYAPKLKHRYVLEHRYIWEQANGNLPEGYIIHHLNGIKGDNRLENLAALPRSAHSGSAVLNVFKARIQQLENQLRDLE